MASALDLHWPIAETIPPLWACRARPQLWNELVTNCLPEPQRLVVGRLVQDVHELFVRALKTP